MHVLLIAGGWSDEREVSLSGARLIHKALEELGHEVEFFDLGLSFEQLPEAARRSDFAFINLHGSPGEDGLVQALLDKFGCPYQGSGAEGSFLALNKAASKMVFEAENIPTPPWKLVTEPLFTVEELGIGLPLFIKPNTGGSSLRMSLVWERCDLSPALEQVLQTGDVALAESFKRGVELTCGVVGDTALPLIMIKPREGAAFFDYENKYAEDGAEEVCPAPVDQEVCDLAQELTLRAGRALGLTGCYRADFILSEDGLWLLEVNTLPGMTATSLLPRAAAAVGMSYNELIAELIRLGLEARKS